MMSVIKSSKGLIDVYNQLVELHDFFAGKMSSLIEKEDQISGKEREFSKKASKMINSSTSASSIRQDPEMARLYNRFVDLYDQYKRKQELYNRMKQLERESKAA